MSWLLAWRNQSVFNVAPDAESENQGLAQKVVGVKSLRLLSTFR
jgi:hypothetical protein